MLLNFEKTAAVLLSPSAGAVLVPWTFIEVGTVAAYAEEEEAEAEEEEDAAWEPCCCSEAGAASSPAVSVAEEGLEGGGAARHASISS